MKFDAKAETERIIEYIRSYYKDNHMKGAVLGVSGGKDSAVVAALFSKALGSKNVVGVALPCHSSQLDFDLAKKVTDFYGIELMKVDLTPVYEAFLKETQGRWAATDDTILKNSNLNIKPRLRMSTLYYIAAALSAERDGGYLVAGTCNKSEMFVGFFTKGADNVSDINVLADLTVEEVIKVGEVLKVPKEALYRVPNDGLSNIDDEKKLGVTYYQIAKYMDDPSSVDDAAAKKIWNLHKSNKHKTVITTYKKSMGKRIAMFGGSFNPIHLGHIKITKRLIDEGIIDKVVFVPVGNAYNKKGLINAEHRLNMVKLAIKDIADMEVSDFEIKKGSAYSYETLDYLQDKYPHAQIIMIMGADNFKEFNSWQRPQYIMDRYRVIVIPREYQVMSTDIRKNLNTEHPDLDKAVYEYIKKNHLYENTQSPIES